MLLAIRNLHIGFRSDHGLVPAVRGVDLQLERGRVLGLVGESGCGKSVTSLAVMGLLPQPNAQVTAGEILFNQQDLLALDAEAMRAIRGNDISMIFQEPMTALNPVFRIGEQIGEVLEEHQQLPLRSADNRRRVIELLQLVRIPRAEKLVGEYPHQLSGGMCQRVMIAMALAFHPAFVVADEPIAALDVSIQAQILTLMQELKEQLQLTYLFISHDLGVVRYFCDRVAVMYLGSFVETGSSDQLFASPRHPYTQAMLSAMPSIDQATRAERIILQGSVPSPANPLPGCKFHTRCPQAKPECSQHTPPLRELAPGHSVACHLV